MSNRTVGVVLMVAALTSTSAVALADKGGTPNENSQAAEHSQAAQHQATPATPATPKAAEHAAKKSAKAAAKAAKRASHTTPATPAATAKVHFPAHAKTTICHATGSAKNPYVRITISDNALKAHHRHQDGRDIIPAPAGGCPGPTVAAKSTAVTSAPGTSSPAIAVLSGGVAANPGNTPKARVLGARVSSPTRTATAPRRLRGRLPFTGWDARLALGLALVTLAGGIGLRFAVART